jgi:hypothetical protein
VDEHTVKILSSIDNDQYQVKIEWEENAKMVMSEKHHFVLTPNSGKTLTFSWKCSYLFPDKCGERCICRHGFWNTNRHFKNPVRIMK